MTPAILHSIDTEGRLIQVSDAWLAKFGYQREDVLGKLSCDFLTPGSRERAIGQVLPEFFRTGRCENVDYQMVCKDGRVLDILLSAVLDPGGPDHECCSLAVITDVTSLKTAERRLSESEALYKGLIESQTDLVSLATVDGELRFVNHAYVKHHNRQAHELIGRNFLDHVPTESRGFVVENLRQACVSKQSVESENQVVMPDGQIRWMAWTNRAITDVNGDVTAIHSVGRDIERRVIAEEELKASEARYRLLAENSTDMVFQLDSALVRRYVSPASRDILGYDPSELMGQTPVERCHPDDVEKVAGVLQSLLRGEADRRSVINRRQHRDGRWIWVEAQLKALRDEPGGPVVGIIGALRDVSKRKSIEDQLAKANRRLEILATQDALTGLANRRAFDAALAREHRRALRERNALGLIMIDVDRFKSFNDRYGHPAGDRCLRQIAGAIAGAVYRPGDLAARYGGEEFAVLLPNTHENGAAEVAERIRLAVRSLKLEHDFGNDRIVTISAGICTTRPSALGDLPDVLLRNADMALYKAKDGGRDQVVDRLTAA